MHHSTNSGVQFLVFMVRDKDYVRENALRTMQQ